MDVLRLELDIQIHEAIFIGIPLGFHKTLLDIQFKSNTSTIFPETLASNLLKICVGNLTFTVGRPKTTGITSSV